MRENLHRFFRAARGAGVHVSPAESIDAMRAVAKVGFEERGILRDTLLLTLAKSEDEKKSLGACFDLFFSQPEPSQPKDAESENGAANENQAPGNRARSRRAANRKISGRWRRCCWRRTPRRSRPRSPTQPARPGCPTSAISPSAACSQSRILEQMGIARLNDDLDALTAANPALAERLTAATDALRESVRDRVSQALLLFGREEAENLRNEILRNAPLGRIEPRQIEEMRALIRQMARRLRERFSKPRKRQRRGHLDVRRTLRKNAAWGSVPFITAWKRKHRDKPKIVALCDVSGSVARVSDFFLLLIHSLHEVVSDVRSFAFSGHLIEVSDILESKSADEAMHDIMGKVGFGSSDYGSSFADFERQWMESVTPQTTVIVLGDARSNNLDPGADIIKRISERSKRLVWLNPEGRMTWGWGDSEMPRYATFCNLVRQCATAQQLERAVSDIVSAYQ